MEEISKRINNLSVKQLALLNHRLKQGKSNEVRISGPQLRRLGPEYPRVASFAQERLWLLHRIDASPAYNLPLLLPFAGQIHVPSLERAIHLVLERHEPLRTVFAENGGLPVPVLLHHWQIPLQVVSLQGIAEDERQDQLMEHISQELQARFDLAKGPVVRPTLFSLGPENHLLLINMHHIAGDGLSLHILTREVRYFYNCILAGTPVKLPELTIRYSDFAYWQRELMASELGRQQLEFWHSQIASIPDSEPLPYDRRGSQVATSKGTILFGNLEEALRSQVIRLAHAHNATPFMVLLSAFLALLFRLSSQEDLVVATPIAGRTASELATLIGCFINTLLLRVHVKPDMTFLALLARVREASLDAFANQDFPFERLVAELPRRNSARNPLFQVMFALQKEDESTDHVSSQSAENLDRENDPSQTMFETWAKFDLSFTVVEKAGLYHDRWEYRTDLFDHSTISNMSRWFSALLRTALAFPDRIISTIPLLSESEQAESGLAVNHQSISSRGKSILLHELVYLQADKTPDLVAVVEGRNELPYHELIARANALARELLQLGLAGPEQRIGIFMDRSREMVIAMLAVLKTGAAYVPLDPAYPANRIRLTISDARLSAVLVQDHLLEPAGRICGDQNITLHRYSCDDPLGTASGEYPQIFPESLAYIIYTSGSTGAPKGVMVPHSAIANLLLWSQKTFPLTTSDAVLQRTSMGFDASVWEVFVPLIAGGRLVLSRSSSENFMDAIREVQQNQVTVMQVVPSLLRVLLDDPEFKKCNSLKFFFSGGEALSDRLTLRFQEQLSAELVNFYGPTETAVDATWFRCKGESLPIAPIGTPIDNMEAYVLDTDLNCVPHGVAGDLYLKGDGLARGYLNQPALTASAFIPCPFTGTPGERMYRTGDLARSSSDGTLHYLGRSDKQVKVRGVRIELAEIEAVLAGHDGILASAVKQRKIDDDVQIIAYIVCKPETFLDGERLLEYLRNRLPSAAIPAAWVRVEFLPLLANGKVDYAALPESQAAGPLVTRKFEAPRTPVEHTMAQIWQEVLHLQSVGISDNFFELGGHSLLASQVISRVRDRFGVEMPFATIFTSPTIAAFAGQLEALLQQQPPMTTATVNESPELDQLIQQINTISEEDAEALLAALKAEIS